MSYTITVSKLTREPVRTSEYVGVDQPGANASGYRAKETEQDIERMVYTQIVDELDIPRVIDAVNGVNKAPRLQTNAPELIGLKLPKDGILPKSNTAHVVSKERTVKAEDSSTKHGQPSA